MKTHTTLAANRLVEKALKEANSDWGRQAVSHIDEPGLYFVVDCDDPSQVAADLVEGLGELGVHAIIDPTLEGQDSYGVLVSHEPIKLPDNFNPIEDEIPESCKSYMWDWKGESEVVEAVEEICADFSLVCSGKLGEGQDREILTVAKNKQDLAAALEELDSQ
jgi:hypothetical protein